ncbi:MAG: hypothetical protein M0R74_09095 [Dehalococcoidia bacterium]|jgi:hypothetical protein|nr:hypothetical protein [Dehalococcoidia bacterium]
MQTQTWRDIDGATEHDVGRIAVRHVGGPTIAIEDTLAAAIAAADALDPDCEDADRIAGRCDTTTDLHYLTDDDIAAVVVEK